MRNMGIGMAFRNPIGGTYPSFLYKGRSPSALGSIFSTPACGIRGRICEFHECG